MHSKLKKLTYLRNLAEEENFKVNQAFAYIVYLQLQKEMKVNEKHQVIIDLTLSHIESNYRPAYHDKPVRHYLIEIEPNTFTYESDGSLYYTKTKDLEKQDKFMLLADLPVRMRKFLMNY